MQKFFTVRLFAKMKMLGDGVLEQMHAAEAQQREHRTLRRHSPQAFGQHLYQRD
jgi:hypothetical protein